jgi:hypothetical protein
MWVELASYDRVINQHGCSHMCAYSGVSPEEQFYSAFVRLELREVVCIYDQCMAMVS